MITIAEVEKLQARLSSDYNVFLPTENVKGLKELKDTIRGKLHPGNKPHTVTEERGCYYYVGRGCYAVIY
jgi:hypothetical protein